MFSRVLLFYWWRLRAHPFQELLAAGGIAAGVALVFSVQVANHSLTGSVEQLVHGITGSFNLELAARDAQGFNSNLLDRVVAIPGVTRAAPVLEARVGIASPRAQLNVELVGVTDALAQRGGPLVRGFGGRFGPRLAPALLVPQPLATQLDVRPGQFVTLATRRPQLLQVPVSATLDRSQVGSALNSPLVVAPLSYVQSLTDLPGKATRILVATAPGEAQRVRAALRAIAAGRLTVDRSDVEIGYVKQAAAPNNQSTGLFAAICMIVGVLFTFNAMLLTVPERRRLIAELRMQGYKRHRVIGSLLFEAVVLGLFASGIGLLLGDQLSRHVLHGTPNYLSFAFPIGTQRVVDLQSVLIALGGGLIATVIATLPLVRDLFSNRPIDAARRGTLGGEEAASPRARRRLLIVGAGLFALTTVLVVLIPATTIVGVGLLAVTMLVLVPGLLTGALRLVDRGVDRVRGSALTVAVMELSGAITRSTALAATGALAVFGTVAIQGAHADLLRGLDKTQASLLGTADVWVTASGDANILMTTPFQAPDLRRLDADPVIASVRSYRGQFLDMAGRRVWVMGRPAGDRTLIPPSQLVSGNYTSATRSLRGNGSVAVSAPIARSLHLAVGDQLTIPTATGSRRLRVAAIVSNLGWAPGAVILSATDYQRFWPGRDVTALEVDLAPGVTPAAGKAAVERALPPASSSLVETQQQREARFSELERQGLARLSQISTLLLIAAILAMGAAMAGAVWQQRHRLAALRMQGYSVARVLRLLLAQAAVVLSTGATIGAAFGLYGQALGTRWLKLTTSFPAIFSVSVVLALTTLVIVAALALLVVAIPGYLAARTDPALAFDDE